MSNKKENKPKIIRINLSLVIGIITVFFVLLSSVVSYKIATVGTNVLYSLSDELVYDIENDEANEENVEEEIYEEEIDKSTDENSDVQIDEGEDEYTSTETDENSNNSDIAIAAENYDDEIAVVDKESSFDYNIIVTEYTGDTLEAECDYEAGQIIWYLVDGDTLEEIRK